MEVPPKAGPIWLRVIFGSCRVLDKIYGGSPIKLLAHLMERHRLSDKELARMRDLLKRSTKRQKK